MADPPAQIGRYRVQGVLGSGGMGTVYRAHDPLIGRPVAVKVLHTSMLRDEARTEYLSRFRQEAQAAGRCMHPAIVAVYDFSSDENEPYIVMELVEGLSLRKSMREPDRRTWFITLLLQVLDGLAYAHRLGITHRDIKPANILITPGGEAKIADFGIARVNDTSLTQAGGILGTPGYMAPEQLGEGTVDQRTDLFSVGAILYEAITGKPPFAGRSAVETLHRLSNADPASMVAVEAADAGAYVPLLTRALAKSPEQRIASAEAFAAALRAAGAQDADRDPLATVVVRQPAQGATLGPATVTGTRAGHRDPATLQRIERVLASYIGPMARVVVEKAARESTTADELYRTVASSLQSASDRNGFRRSLGNERVEPTLDRSIAARPTLRPVVDEPPPASPPAAAAISPEAMAAAQSVLAFFVGPIARLLVREAAGQATSARDFIDRLCTQVDKPGEEATLRRRLRAEVEPKL